MKELPSPHPTVSHLPQQVQRTSETSMFDKSAVFTGSPSMSKRRVSVHAVFTRCSRSFTGFSRTFHGVEIQPLNKALVQRAKCQLDEHLEALGSFFFPFSHSLHLCQPSLGANPQVTELLKPFLLSKRLAEAKAACNILAPGPLLEEMAESAFLFVLLGTCCFVAFKGIQQESNIKQSLFCGFLKGHRQENNHCGSFGLLRVPFHLGGFQIPIC